jgi:rare lipoprotein A
VDSEESVVVRINDRGPFVPSRIIDVSQAAAHRLGMHGPGVVRVSVEVLETAAPPVPSADGVFAVQAGTFRNAENAQRTRDAMERRYGTARVVVWRSAPQFRCVLVGEAATAKKAGQLANAIRANERGANGVYVVRLDRTSLSFAD